MDIEQRALELVNEVRRERGETTHALYAGWREGGAKAEALCRAIEAGDAEREAHDAYRQRVSEIAAACKRNVDTVGDLPETSHMLSALIIQPKTDPLVEALDKALLEGPYSDSGTLAQRSAFGHISPQAIAKFGRSGNDGH